MLSSHARAPQAKRGGITPAELAARSLYAAVWIGGSRDTRTAVAPTTAEAHESFYEARTVSEVQGRECKRQNKDVTPLGSSSGKQAGRDIRQSVNRPKRHSGASADTRDRTQERQDNQQQYKRRGREVARSHLPRMLLHHSHFPITILKVLPP